GASGEPAPDFVDDPAMPDSSERPRERSPERRPRGGRGRGRGRGRGGERGGERDDQPRSTHAPVTSSAPSVPAAPPPPPPPATTQAAGDPRRSVRFRSGSRRGGPPGTPAAP